MQFSENNNYREYFVDRFDIPRAIMENYTFWVRGKRVWAFSGEYVKLSNIEILGIKALTLGAVPKPSTAFLRVVGKYARKNVIELTDEDAFKYLKGENIEKDFQVEPGYVIVKHNSDILGCGLYKDLLINLLPKKYRFIDTWV